MKLREALRAAGVTQAGLAQTIGIAQSTIAGYISGRRGPSVERAKQIATALGVGLDDVEWPEGSRRSGTTAPGRSA